LTLGALIDGNAALFSGWASCCAAGSWLGCGWPGRCAPETPAAAGVTAPAKASVEQVGYASGNVQLLITEGGGYRLDPDGLSASGARMAEYA
jgi:hypothetical protein